MTRALVDVNVVIALVDQSHVAAATSAASHEFWPDDVSILDANAVVHARLLGPAQLTDVYLLALAVAHHGRFVTFDRGLSTTAVVGATDDHLVVL